MAKPYNPAVTKTLAVARDELVGWLDEYLDVASIPDKSMNGLQLAGHGEVRRVAVAVDSTLATVEAAIAAGADLLITHHGWFWGEPLAITGMHGRRVRTAIKAGLSLYVAHLPLDLHPIVGNNVLIAKLFGLLEMEPFGRSHGLAVGVKGRLPLPKALTELADTLSEATGGQCLVHSGGKEVVETLGIVSGGAAGMVGQAAAEGLDCFITGEPSHANFADPFELGVNAIFGGHYETETFGVRAIAEKIEARFDLPWQFLELPTGL